MQHLNLLLSENSDLFASKVEIKNRSYVYRHKGSFFSLKSLTHIIRFINAILIKYKVVLPVVFDIGNVAFEDKLTYILFECLCDYLIEEKKFKLTVNLLGKHHIHTDGLRSSPLLLLSKDDISHREKFKNCFHSEIYRTHYRKVFEPQIFLKPELLCQLMDDIAHFQKVFDVSPNYRECITEVIVELVGNAKEHGEGNCLLDFDIAPFYSKVGSDLKYVGINIAIVNFSKQLLGDALKSKLQQGDFNQDRFSYVKQAYICHSAFFDEKYCEDDFFTLTAFQHKISSRRDNIKTGGTGLTKLIESLESKSDAHMCYVISGLRRMHFEQSYLRYNTEGWLGFNPQNDYISSKPDTQIFESGKFVLPGTAYNLNFVLQKEE